MQSELERLGFSESTLLAVSSHLWSHASIDSSGWVQAAAAWKVVGCDQASLFWVDANTPQITWLLQMLLGRFRLQWLGRWWLLHPSLRSHSPEETCFLLSSDSLLWNLILQTTVFLDFFLIGFCLGSINKAYKLDKPNQVF